MKSKLFQMKCRGRIFLSLAIASSSFMSCNLAGYDSPDGYDMSHPRKSALSKDLNEISGLSYDGKDNSLLTVSDSKKKIIGINLIRQKLFDYSGDVVGANSDLEDLVSMDSVAYILSSKGIIYQVPKGAKDTTGIAAYKIPIGGTNDFETLYYDSSAKGLIMLCKTCEIDKSLRVRSAFRFDLTTKEFDTTAYYKISTDSVKRFVKNDEAKFDPSGAAISPINKKLYILSSAGNLIVITDLKGNVSQAYYLNPDKHPQAEGIAFAPNGDMYISDEGKYGKPTLTLYPYGKSAK